MEQTDKQYTDNMIHTDTKAQATKAKKKKTNKQKKKQASGTTSYTFKASAQQGK